MKEGNIKEETNEIKVRLIDLMGDTMSKYISIFFLFTIVSVLLFFMFGSVFMDGGNPAEETVYIFGTIIVLLLSFIISQLYYLIDLFRKNR
ncbi:hypothetical protein [Cytobacillus pseudoceanisediminis]|uniref:hypothetical protein n=1 Tax=Cytobacillus pseudoceanisediminis TaxID=3051614 RepID=UPI003C2E4181